MNQLLKEKLISTKDASALSGYTSDYLSRLCREGKIEGTQVGRTWLVDRDSLEKFIAAQIDRKVELAESLAREREREYRLVNAKPVSVTRSMEQGTRTAVNSVISAFAKARLPHDMPAFSGTAVAMALTALVLAGSAAAAGSGVVAKVGSSLASFAVETRAQVIDGAALIAFDSSVHRDALLQIADQELAARDNAFRNVRDIEIENVPAVLALVLDQAHAPVAPAEIAYQRAAEVNNANSKEASFAESIKVIVAVVTDPLAAASSVGDGAIRTYTSIGALALRDIETLLSGYTNVIAVAGENLLNLSTGVRDTTRSVPLAIGSIFVEGSEATFRLYVSGVYDFVAFAYDAPPTIVGTVLNVGSAVGGLTQYAVIGAPQAYESGLIAFSEQASQMGEGLSEGSFVIGSDSRTLVAGVMETQDRAIAGFVGAARGTVAGVPVSGPVARASTPFEIAMLPSAVTNEVLGFVGNVALLIENLEGDMLTASPLASLNLDAFVPGFIHNVTAVLARAFDSALHGVLGPMAGFFGAGEQAGIAIIPGNGTNILGPGDVGTDKDEPSVVYNGPVTIIKNEYPSVTYGGVAQTYVDERLEFLRRTLYNRIEDVADNDDLGITSLDGLAGSNMKLNNPTIVGGTITDSELDVGSTTVSGSFTVNGNGTVSGTLTTGDFVATNATTTNFYASAGSFASATIDALTAPSAFITNLIATNSTTTNATSTNLYVSNLTGLIATITDAFFTNVTASLATLTNAVITTVTATNATLTNATSTNATTTGSFALTYVTPSRLLSVDAFGKVVATNLASWVTGTANQITVTDSGVGGVQLSLPSTIIFGTTSPTTLASGGATSTFGGGVYASRLEAGEYIAGPYVLATSTTATSAFSGNIAIGRNATLGTSAADTLVVNATVGSNFVPSINNAYDLGSSANNWRRIYVDEVVANNLSAASTSIAGTVSSSFVINSDNATNDTEDMSLTFNRGSASPNAILAWNSITKRFEFNMPVFSGDGIFTNATSTNLTATNFTLGGSTFTSFLGNALTNVGGVLSVSTTSLATGFFQQDGNSFGTTATLGTNDSNALAFETAGTERLRILTSGNVGIGTSNPTELLHLHNSSGGDVPRLKFTNGTTGVTATDGAFVGISNSSQLDIWNFESNLIRLGTANALRMVIDASGNVGIGTTSPQGALTVHSGQVTGARGSVGSPTYSFNDDLNTGIFSPAADQLGFVTNGAVNWYVSSGDFFSGSSLGPRLFNEASTLTNPTLVANRGDSNTGIGGASGTISLITNSLSRLFIENSGNVGIGTTTPNAQLEVYSTGLSSVRITGGLLNTHPSLTLLDEEPGGAQWNIENGREADGTLGFYKGGTRMVIDTNGNVGIGTSTPSTKLQVAGDIANVTGRGQVHISGVTDPLKSLDIGIDTTNNRAYIAAGRIGTSAYPILINPFGGNVSVGTTSATQALTVAGNAYITGALYDSTNSAGSAGSILSSTGTGTAWVATSTLAGSYFQQNGNSFGTTATLGTNDSNALAFETAGTERLRILTNGNVGIGTSSPAYKLDVWGSNPTQFIANRLVNSDLTSGASVAQILGVFNGNNGLVIEQSTNATGPVAWASGTYDAFIRTAQSGSKLHFASGGATAPQMTVSGGNVGIGTTTPLSPLHVQGSALRLTNPSGNAILLAESVGGEATFAARNSANRWATGVNTTGYYFIYDETSGNVPFRIYPGASGGGTLTLNNGNVGIGTTNPSAKLSVTGNAVVNGTFRAEHASDASIYSSRIGGASVRIEGGSAAGYIKTFTNHPLFLGANNSDYVTISTAGNVGIGTTTPAAKLQVLGNILAGSSGEISNYASGVGITDYLAVLGDADTDLPGIILGNRQTANDRFQLYLDAANKKVVFGNTFSSGSFSDYVFRAATTDLMTIKSTGNVGIGTSSPSSLFQVVSSGGFSASAQTVASFVRNGATASDSIISVIAGNAAKSIIRLGDTDSESMGLIKYDHALNALAFGTNGVNDLVNITSTGSVGIGTASPSSKLHVVGSAGTLPVIDGNTRLLVQDNSTTGTSAGVSIIAGNASDFAVLNFGDADSENPGRIQYSNASNFMAFRTNGADRVRIDASGNVGIGTTTPSQKLTVSGSAYITGALYDSTNSAGTSGQVLSSTVTGTAWTTISTSTLSLDSQYFRQGGNSFGTTAILGTNDTNDLQFETNNTTRLTIASNTGYVGIGTAAFLSADATSGQPNTLFNRGNFILQVPEDTLTSRNIALVSDGGAGRVNARIQISKTSADSARNGTIALYTTRANIENLGLFQAASGNVAIGTTSPQTKLHIYGSAVPDSAAIIQNATFSTSTTGGIVLAQENAGDFTIGRYGVAEHLRINASGNVGIGTTSPSLFKLQVAGNIGPDATGTYNLGSASARFQTLYVNGILANGAAGSDSRYELAGGNLLLDNTYSLRFKDNGGTGFSALSVTSANNVQFSTPTSGGSMQFNVANASGAIQFLTNGTERIRVTNAGNVGIGTTNPSGKLNVNETVTTATPAYPLYLSTASGGVFAVGVSDRSVANPTWSIDLGGSEPLSVTQGGVNRIFMNASGDVGIGTTSPFTKLSVEGNGYFNGTLTATGALTVSATATSTIGGNSYGPDGIVLGSTDKIYSPDNFNIYDTSVGIARFGFSTSNTYNVRSTGSHLFQINGTQVAVIDVNGRLGINDSTPDFRTEFQGTSGSGYFGISNAADGDIFTVNSSGNVGIGTSNPQAGLSLGSTVAGTGIVINQTVDDVTNYSRGRFYYDGSTFTLRTEKAGSGVDTPLRIYPSNGIANIYLSALGTDANTGFVQIGSGNNTQNRISVNLGVGSHGASVGTQTQVAIQPTIAQSSTANYIALSIKPTESSLGSGSNYLFQAGTSTAPGLFSITNTGNVGIGTAAPVGKLDVVGNILSRGSAVSYTGITNAGVLNYDTVGGVLDLAAYSTGGNTSLRFTTSNAGTPATRMTITNAGDVGIGVTAPSSKLHLLGATASTTLSIESPLSGSLFTSRLDFFRTGVTGGARIETIRNASIGGVGFDFQTTADNAAEIASTYASRLTIINSGNVGINTTNPSSARLEVQGGSTQRAALFYTADSAYPAFEVRSTNNSSYTGDVAQVTSYLGDNSSYNLLKVMNNVDSSPSTKFIVRGDGNVGIGTASPGSKLEIENNGALDVFLDNIGVGNTTITLDRQTSSGESKILLQDGGVTQWGIGAKASTNNFVIRDADSTERLTILKSNGNVGIGTTTPSYRLHVAGGTLAVDSGSGTDTLVLRDATLTKTAGTPINSNTGMTTVASVLANGWTVGNFNNGLFAPVTNSVALGTNGAERLRIDSSGNVGIGTTSPNSQLNVVRAGGGAYLPSSGTTPTGSIFSLRNSSVNNTLHMGLAGGSPFGAWIQAADQTNLATTYPLLLNPNGGNVGIGTTNPIKKLDIVKNSIWSAESTFGFGVRSDDNVNYDTGIWFGADAANDTGFIQSMNGGSFTNRPLSLQPNGGNVGIGSTTPNQKLVVAGNGTFANTTTGATQLRLSNVGSGVSSGLLADDGVGTEIFSLTRQASNTLSVSSFGNIGFAGGATGGPSTTYQMYIAGSTGNVGIGTTTPATALSVYTSGTWAASFQGTTGGAVAIGSVTGVPTLQGATNGSVNATANIALNPNGGNVGIGTTNPGSNRLMVQVAAAGTSAAFTDATNSSLYIKHPSAGILNLDLDSGNQLTFSDGGVENLRITGLGNVGIGTTTPLSNSLTVTDRMVFTNNIANNAAVLITAGTGSFGSIQATNAANSNVTNLALQQYGGNVGIGTTTPDTRLSVVGNGKFTNADARIDLVGSRNWYLQTVDSDGRFRISDQTGLAERLTITTTGNVGIGTTTPGYKLDVAGDINIDQFSSYKIAGNTVLYASTTNQSVAVGASGAAGWMAATSTSFSSVALGHNALSATPTASNAVGNVAVGHNALTSNTSGFYNVGIGQDALRYSTSTSYNVAIGYRANKCPVGGCTGIANVAIGAFALDVNTTGYNNVAVGGANTLQSNTTGYNNFALGRAALTANTTGYENVAIGTYAATANTIGSMNTSIGGLSLYDLNVTANNNTGRNTAIGYNTGRGIVTGLNNTIIGANVAGLASGLNNNIILATGDGTIRQRFDGTNWGFTSGSVGIGTSTPTAQFHTTGTVRFSNFGAGTLQTDANGNVSASSDERLKNVEGSFARGLEDLMGIDPINYKWKASSGFDTVHTYTGFSAQNVEDAIPEAVSTDSRGYLTLSDRPILAATVNAVKELNTRTLSLAPAAQNQQAHSLAVSADASVAGMLTVSGAGFFTGELTATTVKAAAFLTSADTELPVELLTAGQADLYKMARFAISEIKDLKERADLFAVRIDDIETRLAALEGQSATSTIAGATGFSISVLKDALESFGIFIENGIAQFNTLVFRQLAVAKDDAGDSSAGSVTILAGNTVTQVQNPYVLPTSKVFVTFTSPVVGAWYISHKEAGSFRVTLAESQPNDVSFDYFILQTEGQLASPGAAGPSQQNQVPTPAPQPYQPVFPQDGGTTTPSTSGDTTPPSISLNGSAAIEVGQGGSWNDQGATASDETDGDLTSQIAVSGSVDTATPGLYTVSYSVSDVAGNQANVSRIITVTAAPQAPAPAPAPEPTPAPEPAPAPAPEPAPAPAP